MKEVLGMKKEASWLDIISFVCMVAGFVWYIFNPKWILLAIAAIIVVKILLYYIDEGL